MLIYKGTKLFVMLLLLITVSFFSSNVIAGYSFDPDIAPNLKGYDQSMEDGNEQYLLSEGPYEGEFMAYAGEVITFFSMNEDRDKKGICPADPIVYVPYYSSGGWFEQVWTISGNASFNPIGDPDLKTKTLDDISQTGVKVYIKNSFTSGTITVTMTLNDTNTFSGTGPDQSGSACDGDACRTKTWTISVKDKCPTSLTCQTSNCSDEKPLGSTYSFKCGPDIDSDGISDYEDRSIIEEWGSITSNIDSNTHVTAAGRAAKPAWGDIEWHNYYFGSPQPMHTGTFIINDQDVIVDMIDGFAINQSTYLALPFSTDLYKQQTQVFTCKSSSSTLTKANTVRRILKAGENPPVTKVSRNGF